MFHDSLVLLRRREVCRNSPDAASSRAERGGAAARDSYSERMGSDDRFDEAWARIAATFEVKATVLGTVTRSNTARSDEAESEASR